MFLLCISITTSLESKGINLSNKQFALEFHSRCNPDDPTSSHLKTPKLPTDPETRPAWRLQWEITSVDFPCKGTAPGITCDAFYDETQGREGVWLFITKIIIPSYGLRCFDEIVINKYKLEHLHTLDISGSDNHIDINTLRSFLLPSVPNVRYLNVGHAITFDKEDDDNDLITYRGLTSKLGDSTFSICNLIHLRHLDLTNGRIDDPLLGSECIDKFTNLNTLLIAGNNFTECNRNMINLPLIEIDVSRNDRLLITNNINQTLDNCFSSRTLNKIIFQDSLHAIGSISDLICNKKNLEYISFRGSRNIKSLPNCLTNSLKHLNIESTSIKPDQWLRNLSLLERLHWGNNYNGILIDQWEQSYFPINGMKHLNYLNLSNSYNGNPSSSNIDDLLLINNQNQSLFMNLHVLDLTGCHINGELKSSGTFIHLKELHLSGNRFVNNLQYIHSFGGRFLETLDLSHNKLSGELTLGMFDSFQSIRVLILSHNDLKSSNVPLSYLLSLKQLEVLDLSHNHDLISTIPTDLPSSMNILHIDLRNTTVINLNALSIQNQYLNVLQLDHQVFDIMNDVNSSSISSSSGDSSADSTSVVACFSIRYKKTNALLQVDVSDTNYLQCLCLGGGGVCAISFPHAFNFPFVINLKMF